MRAIGYFRLGAREDQSAEVLRARFEDFCHVNLHQPISTLEVGPEEQEDPGLQRLIDHLDSAGSGYLVVVASAADLGDSIEAVVRSLTVLDHIDVQVVGMDEEYPNPLQNAMHLFGFEGVSPERSSRVRESMSVQALQGRALGRPPYGYRIGPTGRLEAYPRESQIVRMIFRMYTRYGLGLRLIVRDLNERGITTRAGGSWSIASVRGLLRNPAYIGTYTRLGMRRPNAHKAIVSPEDFRAAQEMSRSRRPFGRVNNSTPFLLSGIAHCAYCGNGMMGVTRKSSWKRKDGSRASGIYRYYQCQSRNNQSRCGYHTWREAELDEAVVSELRSAVAGDSPEVDDERLAQIRASHVANAERRLIDAVRRAAREEIATRTLGQYLAELDAARGATTSQQIDAGQALDQWASLDFAERRALIVEQVSKIVVTDDRVEVLSPARTPGD